MWVWVSYGPRWKVCGVCFRKLGAEKADSETKLPCKEFIREGCRLNTCEKRRPQMEERKSWGAGQSQRGFSQNLGWGGGSEVAMTFQRQSEGSEPSSPYIQSLDTGEKMGYMTHFSQRQFQECPPNLCIYQTSILLSYWTSLLSLTLESSIFQRFDFLCVHILFLIWSGYGCRFDFIQSQAWGTERSRQKLSLDHFPEKTVSVMECTWSITVSISCFFKKEKDH